MGVQVPVSLILTGLDAAGLIADEQFAESNRGAILKSATTILFNVSSLTSFSEGGTSMSFDKNAIATRLTYLANLTGNKAILNALNPQPKIKFRSM